MKLTRIFSMAAAAVLLVTCLLIGGCSTPEVALEVNGKKYTTGDYLAYVYYVLANDSTVNNYVYYLGLDALSEKVTYEDDEISMKDYILRSAQDIMTRQAAVEALISEYGFSLDQEDLKELDESYKELPADSFIDLGFNNQRYYDMHKALNLNEPALFYGLYGKGGTREVPETDIRNYFDENHMSFKIVEISLVNSDQSEKTDAEVKKIQERLQRYLDAFNATGKTGSDFDKTIYAPYVKDEEEAKKTTSSTTTTAGTTTSTTVATTTTSSAAATTTTTASSTDNKTDSTTNKEEKVEAAERYDLFKDEFADEDLFKAVKEIPAGSAAIKTYQKGGNTKTMALIFRMDSQAERTKTDKDGKTEEYNFYDENHDSALEAMKYEEYNADVEKKIEDLADTVVRYERALKAPKLKEMITLVYGG